MVALFLKESKIKAAESDFDSSIELTKQNWAILSAASWNLPSLECAKILPAVNRSLISFNDNLELSPSRGNWLETDYLKLYFEAVDIGEADRYLINELKSQI